MTETTQRRIFRYLQSNRVHPALLLTGPSREEKVTVAIEMAKFLLCSGKKTEVACGKCSDCGRVARKAHPDLVVFGLAEEGEEEDLIKIETVREITHYMDLSSHEGKAKICIVDEAHRMNSAAQNAFLKTLEEPGVGRYFILLSTQPGRLLTTVLSRCLEFSFKPEVHGRLLTPEERQKYLKLFSDGLKEKGFSDLTEELSEKADVMQFVRTLQTEMREGIVEGRPLTELQFLSEHEITRLFDTLVELEGRLRSNANPSLMLEGFLEKNFLES